ncbi:MAG: DoxX family protein [Microscillaceae bacterium]|nr:DoxX family protein [Microscillaceae bacterium]
MLLDILNTILPAAIVAKLLLAAYIAVLFLQSGLDKVNDWRGNLDWLTGYFAKTFLKGQVPMLLATVTLIELAAGVCSLLGFLEILFVKSTHLALLGAELAAMNMVMLFFGQRIAKDYNSAAAITPYFILMILAIGYLAN